MKKILLLITVSVFAFKFSNAQTEKGNHTLGINLGFGYGKSNETEISTFDSIPTSSIATTKTTNFSIGPNYSYFIADKLDIGVSLQYQSTLENDYPIINGPGEKETWHTYGASIYLRKYFMYGDKIGLRTGPYLSYTRENQKDVGTGTNTNPLNDLETKRDNYNAGINLDLVFYPSKHLGLAATLANLAYTHFKTNDGPGRNHETGDNVNFAFINNGLTFSVFYVFGGK